MSSNDNFIGRDIIKKIDNKLKSKQDDVLKLKKDVLQIQSKVDNISLINKAETKLKIFLMLKADCRVLLTTLYDNNNNNNNDNNNLEEINNELNEFEIKYEYFETLKITEQIQNINDLLDIRDTLINRLTNDLLSHTDILYLHNYNNDGIVLDLCSYSIPSLLTLFNTYKYINSQMKIIELHKGSIAIEQISILQSNIDNLKESLKNTEIERDQNIDKIKSLIEISAGRYTKTLEMQDKIVFLEDQQIKSNYIINQKDIENRKLKQIIGQMQDTLTILRSQLNESKECYVRDIAKFQPVLEQYYFKAIEEEKQIISMRSNANIGFERSKFSEKQKQIIQNENEKINIEMKILKADISMKEKMFNQVIQENERLKQINVCLTAAKIKFHEMTKTNELKVLDEKNKIKQYNHKLNETNEEMREMEQYILQLQQLVESAETSERNANDKLALFIAEKEGDALFLHETLGRLEKVEEAGLSESKQKEFDDLNKKNNELEIEKKKLKEQLSSAMHKVYDLQTQLLNAKS